MRSPAVHAALNACIMACYEDGISPPEVYVAVTAFQRLIRYDARKRGVSRDDLRALDAIADSYVQHVACDPNTLVMTVGPGVES